MTPAYATLFIFREFRLSPLAVWDNNFFGSINNLGPVSVETFFASEKDGVCEGFYYPCSQFLEKKKWLCFTVKNSSWQAIVQFPLKIVFEVENHGAEAAKQTNNANHTTSYNIDSTSSFQLGIKHWEHTLYRGLHFMKISIYKKDSLKYQRKFGICIL